jgi:hypothetical protein
LRKSWWIKNRRAYSEKLRGERGHRLKELQDIAKKRGGRCLSKKWDKVSARYKFECGECDRVWMTSALHIFHGQWCRVCASRRNRQKQLAREKAKRRSPAPA